MSNFLCTFNDFWEEVKVSDNDKGCAEKVASWYKLFLTDYPEAFGAGKEMDFDEGETRPKGKINLAEIRGRLLCKRTAERFTDYEGVMSDPNLTLTEKIIFT